MLRSTIGIAVLAAATFALAGCSDDPAGVLPETSNQLLGIARGSGPEPQVALAPDNGAAGSFLEPDEDVRTANDVAWLVEAGLAGGGSGGGSGGFAPPVPPVIVMPCCCVISSNVSPIATRAAMACEHRLAGEGAATQPSQIDATVTATAANGGHAVAFPGIVRDPTDDGFVTILPAPGTPPIPGQFPMPDVEPHFPDVERRHRVRVVRSDRDDALLEMHGSLLGRDGSERLTILLALDRRRTGKGSWRDLAALPPRGGAFTVDASGTIRLMDAAGRELATAFLQGHPVPMPPVSLPPIDGTVTPLSG